MVTPGKICTDKTGRFQVTSTKGTKYVLCYIVMKPTQSLHNHLGTGKDRTVQVRTVQYSTIQYITVQYSTVQDRAG